GANGQPARCEDVTDFAVAVFDEGDSGRAIWIVLDRQHLSRYAALLPFEINLAIFLLVPAAYVTRCQPPVGVTATGLFLRLYQTLFRSPLGNLLERGQSLEP